MYIINNSIQIHPLSIDFRMEPSLTVINKHILMGKHVVVNGEQQCFTRAPEAVADVCQYYNKSPDLHYILKFPKMFNNLFI